MSTSGSPTAWLTASHRFIVSVTLGGFPSPVDTRFSKISGLRQEVEVSRIREGGDSVTEYLFASTANHGAIMLERGVMPITPMTIALSKRFATLGGAYCTILVMALGEKLVPLRSWIFEDAIPTRWEVSDLDANSNAVLINRFEFAFGHLNTVGLTA